MARAAAPTTTRGAARRSSLLCAIFSDEHFPLQDGSHRDAVGYRVSARGLEVGFEQGGAGLLKDPGAFAGFQGAPESPSLILLKHHGLHVELHIDRAHAIGRNDAAGLSDVVLESAVTTIQDCEDSVAAVDRRRQGARLSQLAGSDARDSASAGRQGESIAACDA